MVRTHHDFFSAALFFLEEGEHKRGQVGFADEVALRFVENARLGIFEITEVAEEDALGELLEDSNFIIRERATERACAERQPHML